MLAAVVWMRLQSRSREADQPARETHTVLGGTRKALVEYKQIRAFCYCAGCVEVIDVRKDIFKLLLLVKGTQCRHSTISPRRSNGSTWSSPASIRSARGSLASSVSWKRPSGCSRATARAQHQEKRPRCSRRKRPLRGDRAGSSALRP